LAAWPILSAAQTPDLAAVMERLERLERANRQLTEEVESLRARLDAVAPAASQETPGDIEKPAAIPVEQRVEITERRIDELSQTKVESSQKSSIRLTGMALFNGFLNSHQSGGADYPVTASAPGRNHSGATLRQTMLGLEFRSPGAVAGGTVHGSVYMDFLAGGTAQEMRLRTASVEVAWKSRSIMAGLEKPIFNPREPSSLAQVGISPLTGTGNLWLWLPQIRAEQDFNFGRSSGLRAQVGVLQTRETAPYAGATLPGVLEGSRPALEGRFEFFHSLDDERRLEFAPGFHMSTTHVGPVSIPSSLFSMDWFFNPWRRLELTGAFYGGHNAGMLGNGYGQGFHGYGTNLRPENSTGGWAQLTVHAVPRIDLHLFSGQQDDQNRTLDTGRIGKNLMFGGNLFYRVAPNVLVGLEASQLRTVYIGLGTRINNHYDLALAYRF
jgi:hypothetical protein